MWLCVHGLKVVCNTMADSILIDNLRISHNASGMEANIRVLVM